MKRLIPWIVAGLVLAFLGAIALRRSRGDGRNESRPGSAPGAESSRAETTTPGLRTVDPSAGAAQGATDQAATAEYVKNAFNDLLGRHRKARRELKGVATGNGNCLVWRETYGYIQARLLAICHPDECEKLASSAVAAGAPREDVLLATKMLGALASRGNGAAESALLKVTQSKDPSVACAAMEELFASDKQGRHRALYYAKCLEGVREAFEYGPYWEDAQTKQVLEQIVAKSHKPDSPDYRAKEALHRMSILESKDRATRLEKILTRTPDPGEDLEDVLDRQRWALRVAQLNPTENTVETLRKRLELGEATAGAFHFENSEALGPTHPGYVDATRDEYYDEALLTYQALGGKLNEHQTRRLTHYGYLGDPGARLKDLLNKEK